jgi:hypothetical protein
MGFRAVKASMKAAAHAQRASAHAQLMGGACAQAIAFSVGEVRFGAMQKQAWIDFAAERSRHADFVGRHDLVAQIWELFLKDTRFVLLTANPGVGKSALVSHCLDSLETAGMGGVFHKLMHHAQARHEAPSLTALARRLYTHEAARGRRLIPQHFVRYLHKDWSSLPAIQQSLVAQIEAIFPCRPTSFPRYDEHYLKALLDQVSAEILQPHNKLLILVLDAIDEIEQADLVNPLQRILPSLPKCVSVLCTARPFYNNFSWIESSGSFERLDLDDAAASNEAMCRAYLESKRDDLPNDFPHDKALQSAQGNVRYLQELVSELSEESRASVDLVPVGFRGDMERIWRYLNRVSPAQLALLNQGFQTLCSSDSPLTISDVRARTSWSVDYGETFLHFARPVLREAGAVTEPMYRFFHSSFGDYVKEKLSAEGLGVNPFHGSFHIARARGPVRNRHAFLIGINNYLQSVSLKYCVNDVLALQDTLKSGGYTSVTVLHDQVTDANLLPTAKNIWAQFTALKSVLDPDDLVYVHFDCHGIIRDNVAYLLAADSKASDIEKSGLLVNAVVERIVQTGASRLCLALDCCHAGVEVTDLAPPDDIQFVSNDRAGIHPQFVRSPSFDLAQGVCVLTGSTREQSTNDWDSKKRSVFSYWANDGLAGAADAANKGFVTFTDLARHTYDGVKQWSFKNFTGGESQDVTARFAGIGDIPLIQVRK